jgi:hypothetical protein
LSRASLIEVYIAALPFSVLAVVAVPGGRCRIETAAPGAPPSATIAKYYFKPSHLDLVLSAAGLAEGEVNRSADVVAALLERTAMTMRAPFETADPQGGRARGRQDRRAGQGDKPGRRAVSTQQGLQEASPAADRQGRTGAVLFVIHRGPLHGRDCAQRRVGWQDGLRNGKRTAVLRPCCME